MSSAIGTLHTHLVFDRRTRVLADKLSAFLERASSVLDVGCGDGTIDSLIQRQRPDLTVSGVDVLKRESPRIPVEMFDGRTLPLASKSVDVVMFVDVLHHTDDPVVLLREASRVARKSILIKDHTMDGFLSRATLRFMDWFGNAHHGVSLPYNYWRERQWRDCFAKLGFEIRHWETRFGLYPFPASLIFERSLHFLADLKIEGS